MERQPKTPDMDASSSEDPFNKEWKRAISINAERDADCDSTKDSVSILTTPSTADGDISTPKNRSRAGTGGSIADVESPLMANEHKLHSSIMS